MLCALATGCSGNEAVVTIGANVPPTVETGRRFSAMSNTAKYNRAKRINLLRKKTLEKHSFEQMCDVGSLTTSNKKGNSNIITKQYFHNDNYAMLKLERKGINPS